MSFRFSIAPLAALALVSALSLAGCKSSTQQAGQQSGNSPASTTNPSGSAASQTPPPPATVDLPTGSLIRVRLDQDLGSKISTPGQSFTATVAEDVVVNGQTV